jgi:caffeoyl-CoA O-methyltransferase
MAKFNPPSRASDMEIVSPEIERYLYSLLPARDEVLAEMEARAEKERIPIVGPLVGRLFTLLAQIHGSRRVMELGSAIGYSTLWWARAVGPQGKVYYTDGDPAKAADADRYLSRAGVRDRVEILIGDAVTKMQELPGEFDVVFCDIDKHGYPAAFDAALPRLREGGLFVCDNTLWSGRVLDAGAAGRGDASTAGVQALNARVYAAAGLYPVILPLRDGVTVAVKGAVRT